VELNLLTGKRNNEMLLGVYVCCMNQIFSELVERMRRCRLVEVSRIGNSCIKKPVVTYCFTVAFPVCSPFRGTVAKHSDVRFRQNIR